MPKPRLMTNDERRERLAMLAHQTQSRLLVSAFRRTLLFIIIVLLIRIVLGRTDGTTFASYAVGVMVFSPVIFVVFYLFNLVERYIIKRKIGDA